MTYETCCGNLNAFYIAYFILTLICCAMVVEKSFYAPFYLFSPVLYCVVE